MKKCARCGFDRENSCFSPDKDTSTGLASWCKICFSEYRKQKYIENLEINRQKTNTRRSERVKWLQDLKKSKPCLDCHMTYEPYCMDFDHVPEKGKKLQNISRMLLQNVSKEKILEEIEKCDLVCVLCHNKRSYLRLTNKLGLARQHRKNLELIKNFKNKPCVSCGNHYAYYNMQLDHIDPSTKLYNICELKNRKFDILQAELAKCQVLCALCHRRKSIIEQKEKKYNLNRPEPIKRHKCFYDASLGLKECFKCGHIKCISSFSKDRRSSSGLNSYCKLCFAEYKNQRRQKVIY